MWADVGVGDLPCTNGNARLLNGPRLVKMLTAIDEALTDVPVTEPTVDLAAQAGVEHRGGLGWR